MEVGSLVSQRTRSRIDAYYRNLHDMIKNRDRHVDGGGGGCRMNLDEEKIIQTEIESVDDDDDDDDVIIRSADDSESESVPRKVAGKKEKARRMVGIRAPAKKRVRGAAAGKIDFVSLLDKDLAIERENEDGFVDVRESITGLPLKFKFEDDDDEQPQKSEWEMEIDRLFADLEVGLRQSEVDFHSHSCLSDDECREVDESRAAMCSRGEHDHVLDEQIGIKCSYCHTLLLHIKYVLPPFCVEPSSPATERGEWKKMSEINPHHHQIPSDWSSISSKGGTVFDLIPPSEKELYPHQLEGFEVMWRNIGGDIDINNLVSSNTNSNGGGCIISHAPGTGKTRLTIVFLHTFLRLFPKCRPVIIAPRGMLLTWEQELAKWNAAIPFHNLNDPKLSHHQNISHMNMAKTTDFIRSAKLLSWLKGGSILGVGYRLFEELAVAHKKKTRCNHSFNKILLQSPDLLVLDEGHTPRNHQTLMWKVLTKVSTQRRIILTGTPFQNNFDELYNTLSLVNPSFSHQITLGKATSRKRRGRRNNTSAATAREEWANLTNSITKNTRNEQAIKKLRAMIQPFVHVHNGSILQKTLPGLKDCLIILKPTHLQQKLLDQNTARIDNFLEQAHLASLISVHPSLVAEEPEFNNHKTKLISLESDPKAGVKTHFLINLIQISLRIHEKVLIFSEFIKPLLHIKKLLRSHLAYNEGPQVMYIDGDLSMKQRQSLITSFNDKNGEAKVLLASQRACSEGISLVGASRVILLDVSWNPSVERQAICRAYRLGQEKMVYVYHLITLMEVKKYARQTEKDRISELIFSDVGEGERDLCREEVCEDKVLEAMVDHQGHGGMFERIVHQPKESDLVKNFGFVDLDF